MNHIVVPLQASGTVGPIIKGLGAALVFLALIVVYLDRMSTISNNMEQISDSIDNVHEDVQSVDLKEMERTSNKLESFLDAQLQNSFSNNGGTPHSGGQNSVRHRLGKSGIDVTISYVGSPDWHVGLSEHEQVPETETVFEIKFDEEVNTQGVIGRLLEDEKLAKRENELYESPTRLTAHSPYLITSSVPTEDFNSVSEWVDTLVEQIDEEIVEIRELNEGFDSEVEKQLKQT